MGRNIKIYNGTYSAQTSNVFDNVSTGYTVPSGKIARIGFNVSAIGGRSGNLNGSQGPCSGFYAGTAGSNTTGSLTNRFLLVYTTGISSSTNQEAILDLTYNPTTGHKWSISNQNMTSTPHLYIGDHMRERHVDRSSGNWTRHNFMDGFSNHATENWGTLHWKDQSNTNYYNQYHHFSPIHKLSNLAPYVIDTQATQGPAHAVAGETIYLFDCTEQEEATWYRHPFAKCQWSMFIIEEDA